MIHVLICLAASDTWYGKLIRKLTKSKYNHAYIIYTSYLFGGWWAVTADAKGLRMLPLENVKPGYYLNDFFEYAYNLDLGLQRTRQMVGRNYDWLGVLGFGLKILVKKIFRRKIDNVLEDRHKLFCSEYVALVLKYAGAIGLEKVVAERASPETISRLLKSNPCYVKLMREIL